jgi:hypothetical protein
MIIQCNGSGNGKTEISEEEAKILTQGEYYFSWIHGPDTIGKFQEKKSGEFELTGTFAETGKETAPSTFTKKLANANRVVRLELHSNGDLTVYKVTKGEIQKVAKAHKMTDDVENLLEGDDAGDKRVDEFDLLMEISKLQNQVDDLNSKMKQLTNAYEMGMLFLRILALVMVIGVGIAGFVYWCLGHDEEVKYYHEQNYAL